MSCTGHLAGIGMLPYPAGQNKSLRNQHTGTLNSFCSSCCCCGRGGAEILKYMRLQSGERIHAPTDREHRKPNAEVLLRFWKVHVEWFVPLMLEVPLSKYTVITSTDFSIAPLSPDIVISERILCFLPIVAMT